MATLRDSATANSPLPPSVEKAYHTKCIELKRRLKEIEDANLAARMRKRRLDRSIEKLRLERAFLFDRLVKTQRFLPDDSDKDTSPPPSPQDRPSRKSRTLASRTNGTTASPGPDTSMIASSPVGPSASFQQNSAQSVSQQTTSSSGPPRTSTTEHIDHRGLDEIEESESLPHITWLPSHTNVIMINGEPKQPPWTIRDIAPRHHLNSRFEAIWPPAEQKEYLNVRGYLPYDVHGNPVLVRFVGECGNAVHIFRDDPRWKMPVVGNQRTDDPWAHRFLDVTPTRVPDDMPREPVGNLTGADAGATAPRGSRSNAEEQQQQQPPPSRDGSISGAAGPASAN